VGARTWGYWTTESFIVNNQQKTIDKLSALDSNGCLDLVIKPT